MLLCFLLLVVNDCAYTNFGFLVLAESCAGCSPRFVHIRLVLYEDLIPPAESAKKKNKTQSIEVVELGQLDFFLRKKKSSCPNSATSISRRPGWLRIFTKKKKQKQTAVLDKGLCSDSHRIVTVFKAQSNPSARLQWAVLQFCFPSTQVLPRLPIPFPGTPVDADAAGVPLSVFTTNVDLQRHQYSCCIVMPSAEIYNGVNTMLMRFG